MSDCNQIFFFFQAEDGIRDYKVTGVQTCALPISMLTLISATPLLFTGLCAAVAFRMQLFNIGGEGQLYAGAVVGAGAGIALGNHTRSEERRVGEEGRFRWSPDP